METHLVSLSIQRESAQIGAIVGVAEERVLTLVSAGDDVVEKAGSEQPGSASHAEPS
jgi:hypothetical protein